MMLILIVYGRPGLIAKISKNEQKQESQFLWWINKCLGIITWEHAVGCSSSSL